MCKEGVILEVVFEVAFIKIESNNVPKNIFACKLEELRIKEYFQSVTSI